MPVRKIITTVILGFFTSFLSYAQEVCDNGIDDDNDGLVDLNDDDCICEVLLPTSLIPNPSFEDRTCCPTDKEMLNCAIGWIQASPATSDYINTCGVLGHPGIPSVAPLPLPDGDGAVGFRDGVTGDGNYKEYVGACLNDLLKTGIAYRLDFFVGFQTQKPGANEFEMGIFGGTSCALLPFGNNGSAGCPSNFNGFDQIATMTVSGIDEWKNINFEFVPNRDYEVLILGSSCPQNQNFNSQPYFFVDRLTLAETSMFGIDFDHISGSVCNNDLILSVASEAGKTYQWYQDGVAIPGETNPTLLLAANKDTEGLFQAVISSADGCQLTRDYNLRIPPYYAQQTAVICENDVVEIGNEIFNSTGIFETTIEAIDGCDSIITLDLLVLENSIYEFDDRFCPGESYSYLDITADTSGRYSTIIPNANNCDSTIVINLSQSEINKGLTLSDTLIIELGETIDIIPDMIDTNITSVTWLDENQTIISEDTQLINYSINNPTEVTINALDIFGCTTSQSIKIFVDKSNKDFYIPNVFTPNGDNINDTFTFFAANVIANISSFSVYDRWGYRVHLEENIPATNLLKGWDGKNSFNAFLPGVYAYHITVIYIDGDERAFSGNVTLVD